MQSCRQKPIINQFTVLTELCTSPRASVVGVNSIEQVTYNHYEKVEGETVVWKRTAKKIPSVDEIKQLATLPAEDVRSLPTEEKELWLRIKVEENKLKAGRGNEIFSTEPIMLVIERKNIFRDSFEQFRTTQELDLRQEIKINFLNEVSQDAGGLIRDWFSTVVEELFNPERHLFKRASTKELAYTINEYSGTYYKDHLDYYYFTGQVLAKALYERNPVKAYLNKLTMKMLLGQEVTIDDAKHCDEEVHRSLEYILSNTISDELGIGTFVSTKKNPCTGVETTVELKENGSAINIDEANKHEFCELFFKEQFITCTQSQTTSLLKGFNSLISARTIGVLDADELELLLCGEPGVDVEDWRANTCYDAPFNKEHPVIKAFWFTVKKLTPAAREKFLQFCTGSRKTPAEGFRGLRAASNKVSKFRIKPRPDGGRNTGYIVAHTCFNTIELPMYTNLGLMRKNLSEILKSPASFQFTAE